MSKQKKSAHQGLPPGDHDPQGRSEKEVAEELLEAIWTCREEGDTSVAAVTQAAHTTADAGVLEQLQGRGLVQIDREQLSLTDEGERAAAAVIRRHRLAEHLLVSGLGMSPEQTEELACAFEHNALPEVVDSISALLGHPTECPHGKPIPPAEGRSPEATPAPLLPLTEVSAGQWAQVVVLRTRDHDRLHQLLSMGISPGVRLRIHQRTPVFVVQVDQSEFAMDADVARDIHVRSV